MTDILKVAMDRRDSFLAQAQELDDFIKTFTRLQASINGEPDQDYIDWQVQTHFAPDDDVSDEVENTVSHRDDDQTSASESDTAPSEPAATNPAPPEQKRERKPRSGVQKDTISAVEDIIREVGRPVPTDDMIQKLGMRGIPVEGKSPGATLRARLHGVPSLSYTRPDGWHMNIEQPAIDF